MIALALAVALSSAILIAPAWMWARRRSEESPLVLLLPVVGVVTWLVLGAFGVGAQSLSNSIELVGVAAGAIVAGYIKALALRRSSWGRRWGAAATVVAVCLVSIAFRLFTPALPE